MNTLRNSSFLQEMHNYSPAPVKYHNLILRWLSHRNSPLTIHFHLPGVQQHFSNNPLNVCFSKSNYDLYMQNTSPRLYHVPGIPEVKLQALVSFLIGTRVQSFLCQKFIHIYLVKLHAGIQPCLII